MGDQCASAFGLVYLLLGPRQCVGVVDGSAFAKDCRTIAGFQHKNLNLAVLNVDVVGIGTERPSEGFTFEHLHRGPLQLNARTLLLRVAYPVQMNVQPLSKLDVIFSEGLTAGEPVEGKLEAFFRSVGIVLDHLRPFI